MARQNFDAWIPEEESSDVLMRVRQNSAIERIARPENMTSQTKSVNRSGGMDVEIVPKGAAYGEDTSANDEVILRARKFGKIMRVAEEDIDDDVSGIIDVKMQEWATSYGMGVDHACLGTTNPEDGVAVPFTSVYRALSQANADTGYTAGANVVINSDDGGTTFRALSYDDLSEVLGIHEDSTFFSQPDTVVIASPAFKRLLRNIKDTNEQPIFVRGQGGDSGTPDTLFDYPVEWSLGARTSANYTSSPAGNPLLIVANRQFLILGRRSGPESVFVDGRDGASMTTDESLLKARARRGFAVGHENAFALLEYTPV